MSSVLSTTFIDFKSYWNCVSSGFYRRVNEICDLLEVYAS